MIDKEKIKPAVVQMLQALGEDINRDGLRDTASRVADFYAEFFSGLYQDPKQELKFYYEPRQEEMIIARDISFYSICEHHLLPFFGQVHIAYIPNENRITGFTNLVRVVEVLSHRPQIQERMTTQIADAIVDGLKPEGVAVVIQAEHLCMIMRGIKKPGSNVITSALRGLFQRKAASRAEFFSLIQGGRPV